MTAVFGPSVAPVSPSPSGSWTGEPERSALRPSHAQEVEILIAPSARCSWAPLLMAVITAALVAYAWISAGSAQLTHTEER